MSGFGPGPEPNSTYYKQGPGTTTVRYTGSQSTSSRAGTTPYEHKRPSGQESCQPVAFVAALIGDELQVHEGESDQQRRARVRAEEGDSGPGLTAGTEISLSFIIHHPT